MRVMIQLRPAGDFLAGPEAFTAGARAAEAAPRMAGLASQALGGLTAAFSLDTSFFPPAEASGCVFASVLPGG